MTKTFLSDGHNRDLVAPRDLLSGDLFATGTIVWVALSDALTGELLSADCVGAHSLPKDTAADAWDQGTRLFYDPTSFGVTDTAAAGRIACGKAWAASIAAETTAEVRLDPEAATAVES